MLPPNTVTFAADFVEQRSRLATFFRLLLAIPHAIVLTLYGFVAWLAVIVAWFALVFTARCPRGLYDFIADYLRYNARVSGYIFLLTDVYPPFSGKTDRPYPVHLEIGPPLGRYSRLLAFFRGILMIPVWIIAYVLVMVAQLMVFLAWFAILFLGRMPDGLQRITEFGLSYQLRSSVYAFLLTQAFPPFDGSPEAVTGTTPAGSSDGPGGPSATVDGIGDPPR